MDFNDYKVGSFDFGSLMLAFIITATFLFLLYWLWTWPCSVSEDERRASTQYRAVLPTHAVKPLYALELEPGIVILQSEDGEFFRILREYESADRTGAGSRTPEPPNCSPENRYIPSYTRGYYQTQPTAPFLHETSANNTQDPFGSSVWTPIRTLSTSSSGRP